MDNFLAGLCTSPIYELVVPSTGKKIKYKGYTVAEEQALFLAKESKDMAMIISNTKNIISNCTFDAVDPEALSSFDIEYIFLKLRSVSVGEEVEGTLKCKSPECKGKINIVLNLNDVQAPLPEKGSNIITLNEDVKVIMKYPGFDTFTEMMDTTNLIGIFAGLIDSIINKDDIRPANTFKKSDLEIFLNNMNSKTLSKITKFVEKVPVLQHSIAYTCNECNTTHNYTFKGLKSFFS